MEVETKKRIALYYPYFMGGGAEAVGLWMIEALKKRYDVTLFTVADVDFQKLNAMYGTAICEDSITVEYLVPGSLRTLCNFLIANNGDFRMFFIHLLIRYFKSKQSNYDLPSSAFNAMDLGRKGIQYIHWVRVLEGNSFYRKISGFSFDQLKSNISIVNSCRVAENVKKTYGIDSVVVFPPVVIDAPAVNWHQKENAFICSGRLVKTKQPHKIIQILNAVRKRGFDIKLYITGGGGGAAEVKYKRLVEKMAQENSSWVTLLENLKYEEYVNILTKCKYGIHYKQEPFGISIAEMVKAGAIPFVRSQGGQVEIVGEHNHELFFDNEEHAVDTIVSVLSDSAKQQKILESLEKQRYLFSTQRFMQEINRIFEQYFEAQASSTKKHLQI
jgi:glycosyltransferase involved in cell wall biosynthesis